LIVFRSATEDLLNEPSDWTGSSSFEIVFLDEALRLLGVVRVVFGLADIIQPLKAQRIAQNEKLLTYRASPVSDAAADQAIMQMYRQDIIGVQRIADVLEQWERPAHDWGDKTAWRLFNAATFALAGKVAEKPDLTKRLHSVLDGTCETLH
jgi:hypothetical protein